MKKLLSSIALFAVTLIAKSQTLSPDVIPTTGGYATNDTITLSWTMGETFNTTFIVGCAVLSQGEQQPEKNITCTGDFTGDGVVNVSDLLIFTGGFGCNACCGVADSNFDGVVNITDLLLFNGLFGVVCS